MVRLPPEYYQQQNRMDYQLDHNPPHDGRASQHQLHNQFLNIDQSTIKIEPRDTTPSPYMIGSTSYRIPDQSPSPQPISPQNLYINTPSPYSLGGGNNNGGGNTSITNQQLISPNNHFNNNTIGNISPNLTMTSLPDFNPYHQQQPQFGGLNYNQWNTNNNTNGNIGTTPSDIKKSRNNNLNTTNFNINTTNNNNNSNNNNDVQQQWNLSTALRQSINNFHILNNNTQNGNNQNNLLQTQSNSNSINLGNVNTGDAPNLSSLLDMDSEQLIHLNSAELRGLSLS